MPIAIFYVLLGVAVASSPQRPLLENVVEPSSSEKSSGWNFNYSSSAPHYFASFAGSMQQWSNTFFPNGHSIAPCQIQPFTKLYHGRTDGDVPPSPEWLAFDIGMAYGIMGSSRDSHLLTYQTTKVTKCVYFDGESAALMGSGQLDSQMLHIYGNVTGPQRLPGDRFGGLSEEYARAVGLCNWINQKKLGGPGWGIEGIVRMNAGFEMIWCNFNSPSLRLVSHLNVTVPLLREGDDIEIKDDFPTPTSYPALPPNPTRSDIATDPANPPMPPHWRFNKDREPFLGSQTWNWFAGSTAHYGSTGAGPGLGETRARILSCGFLSYYAPHFSSESISRSIEEMNTLNLTENGLWAGPGEDGTRRVGLTALTRRRRAHILAGISLEDAELMKQNSEQMLTSLNDGSAVCSGMDWTNIANEIVQTFASPLATLLRRVQLFDELQEGNKTSFRNWLQTIREETHTFLLNHIEYPKEKSKEEMYSRTSNLYKDTFLRCQTQHTRLLDPKEGAQLGREEAALKRAVEEVMGGICYVVVDIGLSAEGQWQSRYNSPDSITGGLNVGDIASEAKRWTQGIEELKAWLGWADQWTQCEEACKWDEKCFIPMWPMMPRGSGRPRHGRPGHDYGYGYPYGPEDGGPPDFEPPPGYPQNGTDPGRGPPRGPRGPGGGEMDETDLWQPVCVKDDFFNTR